MTRGDKRKLPEDAEDQGDAKKRQPSEEDYLNDLHAVFLVAAQKQADRDAEEEKEKRIAAERKAAADITVWNGVCK